MSKTFYYIKSVLIPGFINETMFETFSNDVYYYIILLDLQS